MHLHTRVGLNSILLSLALGAGAWSQATPKDFPQAQTVPLRYARPWQVLGLMHWDDSSRLPAGVRSVQALPDTNALRVEATPEGLARIRDIAQNLDIRPRPVQVRIQFVRAARRTVDAYGNRFDLIPIAGVQGPGSQTLIRVGSGSLVTGLLAALTQGQPDAGAVAVLVTSNNVPATETAQALFRSPEPDAAGSGRFPVTADTKVRVSPRINSDDTITLDLAPSVSLDGPGKATTETSLQVLRTVRSDETMVLGGFPCDSDTELLLFVTPTLLPN